MRCHRCDIEIPEDARFCSGCGLDVDATTPMHAIGGDVLSPSTDLPVVRAALAGEYDVKEEIGRGGMATVFRAHEVALGREVAIKVLPFSHVHDASLVERFQNEARTAARLEHLHIIPIYRVGRVENVIFFSMRYVRGPSLSELLGVLGGMEPQEIRRILIECARALGYAHAHGVVHRDIKPDNIMFKESGDVLVCDFGIARAATSTRLTGTGTALGTPYYMSPEQLRAQALDGRSDLYSLGVVGFQCLANKLPFDGEDAFAIGYKHITEEVPTPLLKSAEHRSLFRIISKLMAKHPDDRYQNADELIAELAAGGVPMSSDQTRAVTTQIAAEGFGARAARVRSTRGSTVTPTTPAPRASLPGVQSPVAARKSRKRAFATVGMLFVMFLGGAGGGGYYYREVLGRDVPFARPLSRFAERTPWLAPLWERVGGYLVTGGSHATDPAPADSLDSPVVAMDSLPAASPVMAAAPPGADSLMVDAVGATDSTISDTAAVEPAVGADTAPEVEETPVPVTGHLMMRGIDTEASVWIDGQWMRGHAHELTPGSHQLKVAAPGRKPYHATIFIVAGDTIRHQVRLELAGQCDRIDEPAYNPGGLCFDAGPRLRTDLDALIGPAESLPRQPSRPAVLLVEVRADGSAGTVMVKSPSDVPEFGILAVEHAKKLRYHPATKAGSSVVAWAELAFRALPSP